MNKNDLIARYQKCLSDAEAIMAAFEGKEMPKEKADEVNTLLGQSDQLKIQLDNIERLAAGREFLEDPNQSKASMSWRPAGPSEGEEEVDEKAWREVEIKTFAVDPLGMIVPKTNTLRFNIPMRVNKKEYAPAFESYMRKGFHDMGPNDRKTLAEGTDSAGGFLVPADYQEELLKKIATAAVVRQYARVQMTSRDRAQYPFVNYNTDDKYTSGARVTWSDENPSSTSHRVTDPVYGLFTIPINTALASIPISLNLIEDSVFDVEGHSLELFAEAFALGEENAFWQGTGAGQPRGILTSCAGSSGDADFIETGTTQATAQTIIADEIVDMAYALPDQYAMNAKWFMNKATEKYIRKLTSTGGEYLWPIINQVGNLGAVPRMLLEYPVARSEFLQDSTGAANTYPIIFGDLKGYLVLDRVGFSVQRLAEKYAEENLVVLLGRKRVGGQVVEPYRMRCYKALAST